MHGCGRASQRIGEERRCCIFFRTKSSLERIIFLRSHSQKMISKQPSWRRRCSTQKPRSIMRDPGWKPVRSSCLAMAASVRCCSFSECISFRDSLMALFTNDTCALGDSGCLCFSFCVYSFRMLIEVVGLHRGSTSVPHLSSLFHRRFFCWWWHQILWCVVFSSLPSFPCKASSSCMVFDGSGWSPDVPSPQGGSESVNPSLCTTRHF